MIYLIKNKNKNYFGLIGTDRTNFLIMNSMEKHITGRNKTSNNILYPVDNEKCMCQHESFHPLTARKGK